MTFTAVSIPESLYDRLKQFSELQRVREMIVEGILRIRREREHFAQFKSSFWL
jgi:hypothetical protein